MSVMVLLECTAKNGDELQETFRAILPDTRKYDGCQGVEVYRNSADPNNLVLVEQWDSKPHYEKYLKWREETGAIATLGGLLTGPPSIRFFELQGGV